MHFHFFVRIVNTLPMADNVNKLFNWDIGKATEGRYIGTY